MSPQERQLRVVELLPGGEQITSRPLHVVAYMDDRGVDVVQKPEAGGAEDVLSLLTSLLAAAATWLDLPPTAVAHLAASAVERITQEMRDE